MSRAYFQGADMFRTFEGDGALTIRVREDDAGTTTIALLLRGRGAPASLPLSNEHTREVGALIDALFAEPTRPADALIRRSVPVLGGRVVRMTYLCDGTNRGIAFSDGETPEDRIYLQGEELQEFVEAMLGLCGYRAAATARDYVVLPPIAEPPPPVAERPVRRLRERLLIAMGPAAILAYLLSILDRRWAPAGWQESLENGIAGLAYALVAGLVATVLMRTSWQAWKKPTHS